MSECINFEEWATALEGFRRKKADIVPPGWINAFEYAEWKSFSVVRASILLRQLWASGTAERKQFRIFVGTELDILRPVWHYRLVKPTSANGQKAKPAKTKKTFALSEEGKILRAKLGI